VAAAAERLRRLREEERAMREEQERCEEKERMKELELKREKEERQVEQDEATRLRDEDERLRQKKTEDEERELRKKRNGDKLMRQEEYEATLEMMSQNRWYYEGGAVADWQEGGGRSSGDQSQQAVWEELIPLYTTDQQGDRLMPGIHECSPGRRKSPQCSGNKTSPGAERPGRSSRRRQKSPSSKQIHL